VLRLKTLGINNVSNFDYIEKPDEEGMKTSIETLKMIGCLDGKEYITSIGRFLVKIPIEPFLARSIIEGLLMESVIEKTKKKNAKKTELTRSIIEILCMVLSAGNLFRIQENFRELAEKVKYKHFSHEKGDFFFLRNIYDQFKIINEYDRS
jgi:HrpA-like RNA helicase